MKKLLLLLSFLCASSSFLAAQPWQINGFKDTVAITILNEGKEAKVQSGSTAATFMLHVEGKLLRLKTSGDNDRLLRLVKVEAAKVDKQYHELDPSLLAGEKLINKANSFSGKKLMIVPEGYSAAPDENAYGDGSNAGEAGGVKDTEVQPEAGNLWKDNWLVLLLGALAVALVSAVITRMAMGKKKTPQVVAPEAVPEQPVTLTASGKEPKASSAELKKVKQELVHVQAQLDSQLATNAELEKKLNVNRSFDSSYFNEAFRKLVAPMHEALESGSRKDILESVLKASMHFKIGRAHV